MTAYRDESAALRSRLEMETARADRAEKKLEAFEKSRTERWDGDVAMFLTRCLLVGVPLAYALFFVAFFGLGVGLLDIFDDTRGLMALFAFFVSPLFVAGPLAAWKLETPSRAGWALGLFTSLFLVAFFPPAALVTLPVLLRGRTRDHVFGALSPRVRVEVPVESDAPAEVSDEEAEAEEVTASRSARAAG